MTRTLNRIVSRDFADLSGAEVRGVVPISEAVMNQSANQAIAGHRGRIKRIEIQIGTDNHLELGVQVAVGPFSKWFRPELVLGEHFLPGSKVLVVSLASSKYGGLMWLLELFASEMAPQGLSIRGSQLLMDFSALPHAKHLRSLQISSRRGVLFIAFELKVSN